MSADVTKEIHNVAVEDDTLRLSDRQWADAFLHFRHKLRAGRAEVQADAEAYVAVWEVVESLVEYLKANRKGVPADRSKLGVILDCLFPGATADPSSRSPVGTVEISYERLRKARNVHVHEGATSRNLGRHAVGLSLAIEEALMTTKPNDRVEAWMVPEPVVAQPWQSVSEVRAALLSGGYSALPFWWEKKGRWYFVSDVSVVRYLRNQKVEQALKNRDYSYLNCCLSSVAVEEQPTNPTRPVVKLYRVKDDFIVKPDDCVQPLIDRVFVDELPVLVVDGSRLVGILTPHDLLV